MRFNLNKNIEAKITEIVERCGARGVDYTRRKQDGSDLFEVLVDTDAGITIDECSTISRALLPALEEMLGAEAEFQLIVSSPGLDQPLRHGWQYNRHKGRGIQIVRDIDGDVASIEGALLGWTDGTVSVQQRDGVLQIPETEIRTAIVVATHKQ